MTTHHLQALNAFVKKYWFMLTLTAVTLVTLADRQEWTVSAGRWLKAHYGPDLVIFSIFLFSGLILDSRLLHKGLGDLNATLAALAVIFIFSPLLVLLFGYFALNVQILTGLFLVAVMPSTLSTGVIMTGAAGGNSAHALFVTILANALSVFSIPLVLSLLLATIGAPQAIEIDKSAVMIKIALMVLLPLALGLGIQYTARARVSSLQRHAQLVNQLLVLVIVWMGLCQSRAAILSGGTAIVPIAAVTMGFHLLLVLTALATTRLSRIGPGRRESVIFMGGQKTLPLSVILQAALFPGYDLALVVCVVHHVVHLIMDAYLVGRLQRI